MLWSPEWGATSLGDELSLVYWKLTRWRGKNQAAWAEKRAQEVLRGMKDWNCKEQHRAVGTSFGPLNTVSLPHSPLSRLRGLPWLTWVLMLSLALGCCFCLCLMWAGSYSHPGPDSPGTHFPGLPSSSTWTFVLSQQSKLLNTPAWAGAKTANTPRKEGLECREMDMKEKRWGWGGQQSQIWKVLRTRIRSLSFNAGGF